MIRHFRRRGCGIGTRCARSSRWKPLMVGALEIRPMYIPHDAPQVALSVGAPGGPRFGLATDPARAARAGGVSRRVRRGAGRVELLPRDARRLPYLLLLRARISGGFGHLANEQIGGLAAQLDHAHREAVSRASVALNNSPERARRSRPEAPGDRRGGGAARGGARVRRRPLDARRGRRGSSWSSRSRARFRAASFTPARARSTASNVSPVATNAAAATASDTWMLTTLCQPDGHAAERP